MVVGTVAIRSGSVGCSVGPHWQARRHSIFRGRGNTEIGKGEVRAALAETCHFVDRLSQGAYIFRDKWMALSSRHNLLAQWLGDLHVDSGKEVRRVSRQK